MHFYQQGRHFIRKKSPCVAGTQSCTAMYAMPCFQPVSATELCGYLSTSNRPGSQIFLMHKLKILQYQRSAGYVPNMADTFTGMGFTNTYAHTLTIRTLTNRHMEPQANNYPMRALIGRWNKLWLTRGTRVCVPLCTLMDERVRCAHTVEHGVVRIRRPTAG